MGALLLQVVLMREKAFSCAVFPGRHGLKLAAGEELFPVMGFVVKPLVEPGHDGIVPFDPFGIGQDVVILPFHLDHLNRFAQDLEPRP